MTIRSRLLVLAMAAPLMAANGLPPELRTAIEATDRYLIRAVPKNTPLKHFAFTDGRVIGDPEVGPRKDYQGKVFTDEAIGWIVSESKDRYRVLDLAGIEDSIARRGTVVTPVSVRELGARWSKLARSDPFMNGEKLKVTVAQSPGPPSEWVSVSLLLVARVLLESGDERTAETVVPFLTNRKANAPPVTGDLRDIFGSVYVHEMVMAFSQRDYARTFEFAEHLMQPEFDGFEARPAIQKLRDELRTRTDDFKSFRLPTPVEWDALAAKMPRPEQIRYLAARLRLLNCWQPGQPAEINYEDPQWSRPHTFTYDEKGDVINPYVKLKEMNLSVADLEVLAPSMLDESFMPSFSYHRDFFDGRTIHQANWVVAILMNNAAGRDLTGLSEFSKLDEKGKRDHVDGIVAWCRANASATHEQALLETLRTAEKFSEFRAAATQALELKLPSVVPILISRRAAFKNDGVFSFNPYGFTTNGIIARLVHDFGTPESVAAARAWLKDGDQHTRFWAALTLVERGDRSKLEGLPELKAAMAEDKELHLTPAAIDPLLALKTPEGFAAAELVLDRNEPDALEEPEHSGIIEHLIFAGSVRARDLVHRGLLDEHPLARGIPGGIDGIENNKPIGRLVENADEFAEMLDWWTQGKLKYDRHANQATRRSQRKAMLQWLEARTAEADAGKPVGVELMPLQAVQWVLDGFDGLVRPP